MIFNMNLC